MAKNKLSTKVLQYLYYYSFTLGFYPRCLYFYHKYLCDPVADAVQVSKHLFLGNLASAFDQEFLGKNKIKHIITVIWKMPPLVDDPLVKTLNVDLPIFFNESTDISCKFIVTNTFIDSAVQKEKNVLVHCIDGLSDSVAIVIAYFVLKLGIHPEAVLNYIQSLKTNVKLDPHLLHQLEKFYNKMEKRDNVYSSKELYNVAFEDL